LRIAFGPDAAGAAWIGGPEFDVRQLKDLEWVAECCLGERCDRRFAVLDDILTAPSARSRI
jgi:hypothetical protein